MKHLKFFQSIVRIINIPECEFSWALHTSVSQLPDKRHFRIHHPRKSCWPAIWIFSQWPRWSFVCTPRRWPQGFQLLWSVTGSGRPRPCIRIRSPCISCQPHDWHPWQVDTLGTHRPWAQPVREVWAERCHCPAFVSCDCDGYMWWPRVGSAHRDCRIYGSDHGHPHARKWRRRISRYWKI